MLKVNLQYFAEEETDYFVDGDFDVDKFQEDFEKSFEEETQTEEESEPELANEEESETETEEEPPSDQSDDETETETDSEEQEPSKEDKPEFQTQKQNEAFAKMRKELQEKEKYAKFVQQIADKNGMKPEDVLKMYEERQIEEEAKQKNVDPETLKRLNALEEENKRMKEGQFAEKFNQQVDETIKKHELKDDDVRHVFDYMAQNGLDPRQSNVKFEDAYFLANRENLVKQEREKAVQEYLESKKERQTTSAVPSGDSAPKANDDFSEEDIFNFFKKHDIQI